MNKEEARDNLFCRRVDSDSANRFFLRKDGDSTFALIPNLDLYILATNFLLHRSDSSESSNRRDTVGIPQSYLTCLVDPLPLQIFSNEKDSRPSISIHLPFQSTICEGEELALLQNLAFGEEFQILQSLKQSWFRKLYESQEN